MLRPKVRIRTRARVRLKVKVWVRVKVRRRVRDRTYPREGSSLILGLLSKDQVGRIVRLAESLGMPTLSG